MVIRTPPGLAAFEIGVGPFARLELALIQNILVCGLLFEDALSDQL